MLSRNAFQAKRNETYRLWLAVTTVLGIAFVMYAIYWVLANYGIMELHLPEMYHFLFYT